MTNNLTQLVLPSFTVRFFPAGVDCTDAVDADLLLVDHGDWEDEAIKVAQEALTLTQPDLKGFTWCAHTALINGSIAGMTAVSEMSFRGHERRLLRDYTHRLYAVVHFEVDDALRANVVANDNACRGLEYGWAQYPSLALDGLTGARLACAWGDALICSTQDTMVLMGLGLFPDRPPAMVVPARMARWFDATPPTKV